MGDAVLNPAEERDGVRELRRQGVQDGGIVRVLVDAGCHFVFFFSLFFSFSFFLFLAFPGTWKLRVSEYHGAWRSGPSAQPDNQYKREALLEVGIPRK